METVSSSSSKCIKHSQNKSVRPIKKGGFRAIANIDNTEKNRLLLYSRILPITFPKFYALNIGLREGVKIRFYSY